MRPEHCLYHLYYPYTSLEAAISITASRKHRRLQLPNFRAHPCMCEMRMGGQFPMAILEICGPDQKSILSSC